MWGTNRMPCCSLRTTVATWPRPRSTAASTRPARLLGALTLRFHDPRHSGAVLAAATGASRAELMGRLGHGTPQAALRYQHAASGRDQAIAELLAQDG